MPDPDSKEPTSPGTDPTVVRATPSPGTDPTLVRGAGSGAPAADPAMRPGDRLGRYALLDRLGAGGMGEVYAAYDPKLDRRVALKLLRPDRLGDDPEGSRARLLREAQAMARLSHPNVVAVHDVGEVGDQVFVAMEFVDGSTLRDFVAKRHPWREVVRIFVLAGRGLAAAHAAGLVHRDFKPDNVLLGKDGAVRVTDFGLVRPIGEPVPPPAAAAPVAPEMPFATPVGPLSTPLTLVGSVMGTPGYMAPEQYLGLATDARTDVFSFCVALWEGLYGKPPFRGESFHVVAAAATTGRVPDPPVGTDVPEPIHQLLLRGLAPDPAKRWPSMEALLVDLGRDPAAGRKRFLKLGAFGLAVALLFGGVVLAARRQSRQCRGERDRWTGVWDRTRQKAVREAFLATGTPFAAAAADRVTAVLDAYRDGWAAMGEEACVATRVKGVQSDAMLNLRMLCLERRLDQAKTITALFARADTGVVESAVSMAHALPPLEECADLVALSARVRPPEDAVLRGKVEAVRTRLGAAQASLDAGRYGEAEGDARQALEAARELGWRPVTAEAALLDGAIAARRGEWSRSEASLHESILAAEASRHDEALVRGWTTLSMTFSRQGKFALARAAGEHAEAFLVGMPRAERLLAEVENNAGAVDFAQGRAKEAAEHHARALALREKALGPSHPDVAQSLTNLGGAESSLGDEQNATQHSQRAVDLLETLYGPDHPRLAEPLTNLAIRSRRKGDLDGAERLYRRAIGLVERGVGKHAPNLALVYSNLSLLLDEKHDLDGAERAARRALEICEENGGDANPTTANALVSLGWLGHRRGEHREALALFERAARVREKALGPKAERLANPLIGMGREWVDLGEARRALAPLERALALRLEKAEHSEKDLAEVRFQLARALFDAGKDRARAVRLASEAHQAWAAAGKDSKDDADRSRAFLDAVKAGRPPPGPPREP